MWRTLHGSEGRYLLSPYMAGPPHPFNAENLKRAFKAYATRKEALWSLTAHASLTDTQNQNQGGHLQPASSPHDDARDVQKPSKQFFYVESRIPAASRGRDDVVSGRRVLLLDHDTRALAHTQQSLDPEGEFAITVRFDIA